MTVLDGALLGALCGWSHAVLGAVDAAGGGAGAPAILELDDGSAPAAVVWGTPWPGHGGGSFPPRASL